MSKRVRTGCVTCRKRRIKCDERKPACLRCSTANFECEGFEVPRKITVFKPQQNPTARRENSLSRSSSSPSPEPTGSVLPWREANWQHNQLPFYHHFVTSTVVRIFRTDHVSFWRDQVAQMSFEMDTVYQALLALGAAHRASLLSCSNENTQEAKRSKVIGLSAYGKALHLLAGIMKQDTIADPWAVLIVLLLCAYFECFMENPKGALRHLYAAIQVLRKSEANLSTVDLTKMAPLYEVILRLDFFAQKLLPYAGSSFCMSSNVACMELPFWSRQPIEFSTLAQSDLIATERHRLIQLVCGHDKINRVVWGPYLPASERPTRDEVMGYYSELLLWKSTSSATFACYPDVKEIYASTIAELYILPIPPQPILLTSREAAVTIIMFNGYLSCALALISTTDEDPITREITEIDAFNLVYQNLSITAGLVYKDNKQPIIDYKSCDALDMGISIFLFPGARRCFSLEWQQYTITLLHAIGHEGLSNAHALANALEIMVPMETASPRNLLPESALFLTTSPLGSIRDRLIPLLMPRGDDDQFSAFYLRYGFTEADSDERVVRIVARAVWDQDDDGAMESLQVDTYGLSDPRALFFDPRGMFTSWRKVVEDGWHGFLSYKQYLPVKS